MYFLYGHPRNFNFKQKYDSIPISYDYNSSFLWLYFQLLALTFSFPPDISEKIFRIWMPFKNDEKGFSFHLKSSLFSQDI